MGRHTSWDHMQLSSKSPGQQELAAVQADVNAPACVQIPIPTAACRVVLVKRISRKTKTMAAPDLEDLMEHAHHGSQGVRGNSRCPVAVRPLARSSQASTALANCHRGEARSVQVAEVYFSWL